jgi:hypothetical protein
MHRRILFLSSFPSLAPDESKLQNQGTDRLVVTSSKKLSQFYVSERRFSNRATIEISSTRRASPDKLLSVYRLPARLILLHQNRLNQKLLHHIFNKTLNITTPTRRLVRRTDLLCHFLSWQFGRIYR